jgi:hypothetical protein
MFIFTGALWIPKTGICRMSPAIVGGGTPAAAPPAGGNIFSENLEGAVAWSSWDDQEPSGTLDNAGWISHMGSTSHVDADNTDVARPTGGLANILEIQKAGADLHANAYNVLGADSNIVYITFFFYLPTAGALGTNATQVNVVLTMDSTLSNIPIHIVYRRTTTPTHILRFFVYENTTDNSIDYPAAGSLSYDTWYKIFIKYDVTNHLYELKCGPDGGSITTVKAESAIRNTHYGAFRKIAFGDIDNANVVHYYIDKLEIDSEEYI